MTASRKPAKAPRAMNVRLILAFIIATVLAGMAFIGAQQVSRTYSVVVARVVVPAGAPLTADAADVVQKTGEAPGGGILTASSLDKFLGRYVTTTIYPGEILQEGQFYIPSTYDPTKSSQNYASHFSDLLVGNQRALFMVGDPSSTYVRQGDLVDVIFVTQTSARRMFTKKIIFAIPQKAPAEGSGTPPGTTLVLDLNAQEVQDLIFAQQLGNLRVAIASATAGDTTPTCQTNDQYFSSTYAISLPGIIVPPGQLPQYSNGKPTASAGPSPTPVSGLPTLPNGSPAPGSGLICFGTTAPLSSPTPSSGSGLAPSGSPGLPSLPGASGAP